jgi:beta-N-acetylhexosaminidase
MLELGPLMLDVEGTTLTDEDRLLIADPYVGGLILFTRNYQSPEQLTALVKAIRAVRTDIIIAVDHEGGRVQRFRDGFTRIPAMACFEKLYDKNADAALRLIKNTGWLMAAELLAHDIDISFAPILDLNNPISKIIGNRAFSSNAKTASLLAGAFIEGMHEAGMKATGKHFPGHGNVEADSHVAIPQDHRSMDEIREQDLIPFQELASQLEGIMPAHVIYTKIDPQPAGFSTFWLQKILREELKFDGVIFSDDLSMEGATVAGSFADRTAAALAAGCDMILVCNNRAATKEVLEYLHQTKPVISPRIDMMRLAKKWTPATLQASTTWQQTHTLLNGLSA